MYAALLTAIVTWISANFALPPDYNHPQLKLVPAVEITAIRPLRVAATAACAPGAMTPSPSTGTSMTPCGSAALTASATPANVQDDRKPIQFFRRV